MPVEPSVSLPHGKTQGKNFFGAEPTAKTMANHGFGMIAQQ
jgi:hypothetical protein